MAFKNQLPEDQRDQKHSEKSAALVRIGGEAKLAESTETVQMTRGFGSWIKGVLGFGKGIKVVSEEEQLIFKKKVESKRMLALIREQLADLLDYANYNVLTGLAGNLGAAQLVRVHYEPYADFYKYIKKSYADDLNFLNSFSSYLEYLLNSRAILNYFAHSLEIRNILDQYAGQSDLVKKMMLNIFNHRGDVTKVILSSHKLSNLSFGKSAKQIRAIIVNSLLEHNAQIAEVFIEYFQKFPDDYINSQLRVDALINYCLTHHHQKLVKKQLPTGEYDVSKEFTTDFPDIDDEEIDDDLFELDINSAREYIKVYEKGGSPYRI